MHIVLFTGGESPDPSETGKYFTWAGKPSFTVAADSGLDSLEKYNIFFGENFFSPDYIIGDMDSLENKELFNKYSDAKIERSPADKDFSDTELGLRRCISLKKSDSDIVTMIGGNGGRADHFIGIYETFSSEEHADLWLCGSQMIIFLESGCRLDLQGVKRHDCISAARIPGFFDSGTLKTVGLQWGTDVMRKKGMPSLSNRISEDFLEKKLPVQFFADGADFLVFVPLGASPSFHRTGI